MNEITMNNNIPKEWICTKLSSVIEDFKRGPFGSNIKKEIFVDKGYKVYEQKNAIYGDFLLGNYFINEKKFNELIDFKVNPGDFIVSCSGTIGKIYKLPNNAPLGIINQALLRIRINKEILSDNFFVNLFKTSFFQKKILIETRGSAMLNIAGVKELKNIEIYLPPFHEQNEIVNRIESLLSNLDAGVESLKKTKEQIKTYKQSVLKWAFEGRLTENRQSNVRKSSVNVRNGLKPFLTKEGELPEGWEWVKLEKVCEKIHYGFTAKSSQNNIGPKLLRITDIQDDFVNWSNVPYCKIDKEEINKYILNDGDIVFARSGATVGKTFLIEKNIPKSIFASYLIRIIVNNKISSKLLYYFFKTENYWNQIRKGQIGIGQPNFNGTKLYNLIIPLPPFPEQQGIVLEIERRFSAVDKLEEMVDKSIEKAKILKQSILKKAFNGELTEQWRKEHQELVTGENSAERLLEKIKKEREKI